jgi:hypothetical protein
LETGKHGDGLFRFTQKHGNTGTVFNVIKISMGDVENQSIEAWWNLLSSFKKHSK